MNFKYRLSADGTADLRPFETGPGAGLCGAPRVTVTFDDVSLETGFGQCHRVVTERWLIVEEVENEEEAKELALLFMDCTESGAGFHLLKEAAELIYRQRMEKRHD